MIYSLHAVQTGFNSCHALRRYIVKIMSNSSAFLVPSLEQKARKLLLRIKSGFKRSFVLSQGIFNMLVSGAANQQNQD